MIKQTNRTLLMEVFNPDKLDLITIIGKSENIESLSDEKIKEINRYLLVESFEEFLDKFDPTVYSFFDITTQSVVYTLNKPRHLSNILIRKIPLNKENDFLKILIRLVQAEQSQEHFKFEDFLNILVPEKKVDHICKLRKEIRTLYKKALLVSAKQKVILEEQINQLLQEASKSYYDVALMLPLAIEDIKMRIVLNQKQEGLFKSELLTGLFNMSNESELSIVGLPNENHTLEVLDQEVNKGIAQLIKKHLRQFQNEEYKYIEQLVIRTFCPLMGDKNQEIDIEEEVEKYNNYLNCYKMIQEEFIKVAKPLIENIMGVYMFFNQYQTPQKDMAPSLLILNRESKDIIKTDYIRRLHLYLKTVNTKNDFKETIWFSIIPSIPFSKKEKVFITRERFKGNQQVTDDQYTDMEILDEIMNIMKQYKIQTFFSFSLGESTTFRNMSRQGMKIFKNRCMFLIRKPYSEYLIPCMPNFTIIPRDNSHVHLGNRMAVTDENKAIILQEEVVKFWIKGVYIKAAYVACGLMAACQCPTYLKVKFKKKIARDFPGVRYDIEQNKHNLRTRTTLVKEVSELSKEVQNEIEENSFGFIFTCENIKKEGRYIKEVIVSKARSLVFNGERYESIYTTLVTTYIERMLRYETIDFKRDYITRFFSSHPSSQKSRWLVHKECINAVLGERDVINYHINENEKQCEITLKLDEQMKGFKVAIEGDEM